jgi:hypothetical protein
VDDYGDCPAGQWAWQYAGSDDAQWQCIVPVKELCALPAWDGEDYDVKGWQDRYWTDNPPNTAPNPLLATVSKASFPTPCYNPNSGNKDKGTTPTAGGETTTTTAVCQLQCDYDPSKFTELNQVQAWEQRYGKYQQDTGTDPKGTTGQGTTRVARLNSTGDIVTLHQDPESPFTPNYESIMQSFCSQKSTNCPVDPVTMKPAEYCSYLLSTGEEGNACRYWMHSYGPYKWDQMTIIGNNYCNEDAYPDSYDCRCVNRKNDPSFLYAQSQIPTNISPGCYYLPCADPSNYIVGTDVMNVQTEPGASPQDNYGLNCGNSICANLLLLPSDQYNQVNSNNLIVECSGTPAPGGGAGSYVNYVFTKDPVSFVLLLIAIICGALFLIFFGWAMYQKYFTQPTKTQTLSQSPTPQSPTPQFQSQTPQSQTPQFQTPQFQTPQSPNL